jgi:hypothetical protein
VKRHENHLISDWSRTHNEINMLDIYCGIIYQSLWIVILPMWFACRQYFQ